MFKLKWCLSVFAFMGLLFFTSCSKENVDDTDIDEEFEVEEILCDSLFLWLDVEGFTLTASVSSGTAPYVYEWSTGETTPSIEVSEDGEYSFMVIDANGCTATTTYDFVSGNCADFSMNIQDTILWGSNERLLVVYHSGGTAPFTYLWSTGEQTPDIVVSESGDYELTIMDANGCVISSTYTLEIGPCDAFQLGLGTYQDSTNVNITHIESYVDGGTAPYSYLWSTGETTYKIEVTDTGTYFITATDLNGCEEVRSISI